MSRKNLLTESEVRQFLKLANIGPVGDAKLTEMYGIEEEEEDAPMDDMGDMGDMGDAEMDMGDAEMDMDDAEMDMDADGDAGGQMVSVDDFLSALEGALEDVLGDEVTVDSDEEEDAADDLDDAEMDMGDAEMDMDDEEPMMEMGADDDELEEQSKSDLADRGAGRAAGGRRLDEEEVVNEVARRVAARLQAKESQENMIDQLAEKIMKRMTSK
jgi:hypothetical protein